MTKVRGSVVPPGRAEDDWRRRQKSDGRKRGTSCVPFVGESCAVYIPFRVIYCAGGTTEMRDAVRLRYTNKFK